MCMIFLCAAFVAMLRKERAVLGACATVRGTVQSNKVVHKACTDGAAFCVFLELPTVTSWSLT